MRFIRGGWSALKWIFELLNWILTLGESYNLKLAQSNYQTAYSFYKSSFDELTCIHQSIDGTLNKIGRSIVDAKKTLGKVEVLIKKSTVDISAPNLIKTPTIKLINEFNSSYADAFITGFGGVSGGAAAVGAWSLVTSFGAASTGIAISSLSGIAATNATLAWFGGGALAAGGTGISGGLLVLGGIIFFPIIYFATKSTYEKTKKIESDKKKLILEADKIKSAIPLAKQQLIAANKQADLIIQHNNDFIDIANRSLSSVYPYGLLSRLRHTLNRLIKIQIYSATQIESLVALDRKTIEFLGFYRRGNDLAC